jgi:hypothetical protein
VTNIDRFNGTIDLSVNPPADMTGITITLNPQNAINLTARQMQTSTLTVNADSSAALGAYSVAIIASVQGVPSGILSLMVIVETDTLLPCGSAGTCLIMSDANITGPSFSGGTIHFTATGRSGKTGFANVTIPRLAASDITGTRVSLNGFTLPASAVTISSNDIDYFIYVTFTFRSPVSVDIHLVQPSGPSNTSGLSPVIMYGGSAGIAIVIVVAIGILVIRRRKLRMSNTVSHVHRGLATIEPTIKPLQTQDRGRTTCLLIYGQFILVVGLLSSLSYEYQSNIFMRQWFANNAWPLGYLLNNYLASILVTAAAGIMALPKIRSWT